MPPNTIASSAQNAPRSAWLRIMARLPWRYVLGRLLIAIPTMLAIITLAFFMMRAAPGNPYSMERKLSPQVEANIKASLGLDQPLIVQYGRYLNGVLHGDLGPSMRNQDKSVSELIAEGLPISLTIGFCSMMLALILGTGLGTLAALRRNQTADYAVMGIAMVGISVPAFVVGPVLALVFGVWLGWFAAGGLDFGRMSFSTLTLPVITLALPQIAVISRLVRASLIETMNASFVRAARARGFGEWYILTRHIAPVAALPLVSYLGPACAGILTGSVVIERVFGLPGMGQYFVDGAINRDYPLVMGVVILYAGLIVSFNLLTDVAYGLLDPKVRYS